MSKTKYMTKFQLEHLKQRVSNEIDPLIEEAQLLQKSIIAELTESAELKLAKKIKADVVIKELENAFQNLEIVQRKAKTFFSKNATSSTLKDNLDYRFKDKDKGTINNYNSSGYGRDKGISPEDCREQLRTWASTLAHKEAEKTEQGQKVKQLKLYKQSAINQIFETGIPEELPAVLTSIFKPLGIVWDKKNALQVEHLKQATEKRA
jgi:hypothetical protein